MSQEDQNTEWKESWQDEHVKWVCGFANAQGGRIFIGIDDIGNVRGVRRSKDLLERIPNKIRETLGIIVDVNLHSAPVGEYIEIVVEPYPYPISYRGQYYYRTGSTTQELRGATLDRFLLQKQGRKWDGVPMPEISVDTLSPAAVDYFKGNASKNQRGQADILLEETNSLLQKLHLMDGRLLKRAAILLFHPHPEKYVTGCYIKIGYFRADDALIYQDTVHGSLFEQVEKTMDLLLTKYLKASIKYQGLVRIEDYPIPITALREALLNALAHKAYESGNPIQISVYDDHVVFWNSGQLPDNLTLDSLQEKHPSIPYNPDIAQTLFRAGLIEAWGIGTIKIVNECKAAKLPLPRFLISNNGFMVEFFAQKPTPAPKAGRSLGSRFGGKAMEQMKSAYARIPRVQGLPEVTPEELETLLTGLLANSINIIANLRGKKPMSRKDIMEGVGLSNQTHNVRRYFDPLLLIGILIPTVQDRPKSKNQRYSLTELGEKVLRYSKKQRKHSSQ